MTALPVRLAHQLDVVAPEQRWLIEGLWGAEAVGIIGGEPKCCKSFLALDMAVAVASATPCLRRFPVARCGRVLLFAAEDALTTVRVRLEGICIATDLRLADLDLQVITAPTLRLDIELDRERLEDTVRALRPILLIFRSIRATAPRRTRTCQPMWPRSWTTCVVCSVVTRLASPSCIMHAKGPTIFAPVKPCAEALSCTPGATAISTCAALAKATPSP